MWHGGEPLTVGPDFYETAFDILGPDSFEHGIRHSIQTNGILINERWCTLFKKHNVSVGVSIDGPRQVHDARRKTRSGRGTFDSVMKGIDLLRFHNIAFSTISVVAPEMLRDIEGTVDFFRSLGSKLIGFNVEEEEGNHEKSDLYHAFTKEAVSAFFRRLAALQREYPELRIRELDSMRRHLQAPPDSDMLRATNQAGSIINFDVDGNVATFSPELLGISDPTYGPFIWANAVHGTWETLISNPAFQRVNAAIATGIRRCRDTCGYFSVCGGGDPSNKLAEHGRLDSTETNFCRLHVQAVADVVLEELEAQLASTEVV